MVFQHLRFIVVGLVLTIATSGCSYLFGSKPDDPKPFSPQSKSTCVKQVPVNVKAWLKDGNADIGSSVDCAVQALDEFSAHVVGKTKNVYTEAELNEFIAEFLTAPDSPNAGDVNEMTQQIMKFKQIVLGGSQALMTKDEIARVKSILLRAKPLLISLSPSIPTLLFNSQTASVADVDNASLNLRKIADLLAEEFDRGESGRPEMGFKELLASAHTLGLRNDSVADWIPIVESLKVLILSGDADVLRPREWAPMVRTIANGWGLWLRLKYNLEDNDEVLGRDFPMTEQAIRQLMALVDQAVAHHDGAIETDVFEKLIDALATKQYLPSLNGRYPSAQTLKDILPVAFGKVLYGRWHTDYSRQTQEFGEDQLQRLHEIVESWIGGQKLILSTLNGRDSMGINEFSRGLVANNIVRTSFVDDLSYKSTLRAQKQLLLFMTKGRPPIHDDGGRLLVMNRKELPDIKKSDLNSLNGIRVLMETVLTGWTHDAGAAKDIAGMTEAETQEAYIDLRDLGRDLNFIDVRSNQAGVRTFMENAIFMSSSDGNGFMGLQESVEWFNFVLSGAKVADKMYHDMERPCGTAKLDVLGNQKLNAQCFRREFLRSWTAYMPNLPHLIKWAQEDRSGDRSVGLLRALESAGRNRGVTDVPLDSSEFRAMMPIAHYLESVFARHDVNHNDVLDNDELWEVFPLLAPFIKKMGNGQANAISIQKTIYSYILQFGEVPSTDAIGLVKLGGWYLVHGWFKESADREKVLTLIGAFQTAGKATRLQTIKQYYKDTHEALRELIVRKEKTNALKMADMFQCLPEAAPILADDLAKAVDEIAPRDEEIDEEDFTTEVKSLVDGDSRLEIYCLPF